MKNVERQCWENEQCSRCDCLKVVGIPSSFNINEMKAKVCTVFSRTGVAVKSDDIGDCYMFYNDKKNFSKRKVCLQSSRVKKKLKNIDSSEIDFFEGTAILSIKYCVPITKCYRTNVRSPGKRN